MILFEPDINNRTEAATFYKNRRYSWGCRIWPWTAYKPLRSDPMSDLKSINFTRGVPATESFPVEDVIDAAVASLQQHGRTMLQYGPAMGFAPLIEWLAG